MHRHRSGEMWFTSDASADIIGSQASHDESPLLVSLTFLAYSSVVCYVDAGGDIQRQTRRHGNFTTIQACATALSNGDTCTVYAGTYNENVTVPAGTAGNYKTVTVNGSDVVTVNGFTLASHTKLIGNCTAPAATGSCGFNIQNTASPSSAACVAVSGATDVYIVNNVMYACGSAAMIEATNSASYVYIRGNTESYACITIAQVGTVHECNGVLLIGTYFLVENNDLSHYDLGVDRGWPGELCYSGSAAAYSLPWQRSARLSSVLPTPRKRQPRCLIAPTVH